MGTNPFSNTIPPVVSDGEQATPTETDATETNKDAKDASENADGPSV
jgi:hypothetical protein